MLKKTFISMATTVAISTTAVAATVQDVENSFYPYKSGVPSVDGLTAGMTINQGNVEQFKENLDPAMYQFVKNGDTEIKVGETTSFDLHPSYVEATKTHLANVKLGDKLGVLSGSVSGRPFPEEPSMDDPRAGEKLAWNYKHGYNWGDSAAVMPFYWKFRNMNSGKVERTLKFNFHFLNFTHRTSQTPTPAITPNPSNMHLSCGGVKC